ncbi:unnamed protein product [Brassica rapa subsp. narinosa]|uniref:Tubulin-specific chaperone A n=1 Tax=Brassica napus TaxID=3708 RepID=A0A816VCU8_BRANA|nr:unnamed protein product [Brassica napus]
MYHEAYSIQICRYPNNFFSSCNLYIVDAGECVGLGESRMMIPDCHKRLEAALADLKSTLAESEVKEGPEVEDAKKTVEEVEKQYPTEDA